MDISSESGFLLTFERFLELIEFPHLEGIKTSAIQLFRKRLEGRDTMSASEVAIIAIESAATVDDVCVALRNMFADEDYEEEGAWIEDQRLELIVCVSHILLPLRPSLVCSFTSSRIQGWDVPIGELVLKFEFDHCFETRMTQKGQALAFTLCQKQIKPYEWTDMSV